MEDLAGCIDNNRNSKIDVTGCNSTVDTNKKNVSEHKDHNDHYSEDKIQINSEKNILSKDLKCISRRSSLFSTEGHLFKIDPSFRIIKQYDPNIEIDRHTPHQYNECKPIIT
jgi:hypothetical protein